MLNVFDSERDGGGEPWTKERLRSAREAYFVKHKGLRLDPEARNLRHTHVKISDEGTAWLNRFEELKQKVSTK